MGRRCGHLEAACGLVRTEIPGQLRPETGSLFQIRPFPCQISKVDLVKAHAVPFPAEAALELGPGRRGRLRRKRVQARRILCRVESHGCCSRQARRKNMLWTIFVILLVLWLLGMVTSYTMGGFIHILLVIAIVVVIIRVIQGRRVV